jgi:nucleoside-diphosphate-sugar epimerase
MRVLMTGHRGFIGRVMAPLFRDAGHEVVGLDSGIFRGASFAAGGSDFPEIELDIRDVERGHLEGFDAVVHLAALSNDGLSNLDADVTRSINEAASLRLAQCAKDAGVTRFLFSSSCSIYGKAGDDLVDEDGKIETITPYTIFKANVERELAKLADDQFSPTYLRNATAYGVSPCASHELVLNNLVAWAHAEGYVLIKSDGTPWRPTVHVEDIALAFLEALTAPREAIHNEAFNVGITEENYSVSELAGIVSEVVPGSRVEYAEGGKPDARSYKVDFGKIRRALPNFSPRWTVREGAEQLYQACREADLSVEAFEGPEYKRAEFVKSQIASGAMATSLRWTTDGVEVNGHG